MSGDHNMYQKPTSMNALQAAEYLEKDFGYKSTDECSALLRRQHAEIQEWRNVFGFLGSPDELGNEWNALKDANSRQHEAIVKLREALEDLRVNYGEQSVRAAKQALADTEEI